MANSELSKPEGVGAPEAGTKSTMPVSEYIDRRDNYMIAEVSIGLIQAGMSHEQAVKIAEDVMTRGREKWNKLLEADAIQIQPPLHEVTLYFSKKTQKATPKHQPPPQT